MLLPESTLHKRNKHQANGTDDHGQSQGLRHQWVIEHLPVILYSVGMSKNQTRFLVSRQCEELLGYTQEEWASDSQIWLKILHPEDRGRVLSYFLNRSLSEGHLFSSEYRLLSKEGEALWFCEKGTVVRNEKGRPLIAEGFMLDISDRKQAEQEGVEDSGALGREQGNRGAHAPRIYEDREQSAREKEELLNHVFRHGQIFQTLSDGFFLVDREGKILETNEAAEFITGYSEDELVGMNVFKLIFEDDFPNTAVRMEAVTRKEPTCFEVTCRHKDERIVQLEVRKNFVVIGAETFFYLFFRDITERKREEAILKQQAQDLLFRVRNLEEVNNALQDLLNRRDDDKSELEGNVVLNVKELVFPYIEKLKMAILDPKENAYVKVLESNLNNIISPFTSRLSSSLLNLTPTEIRVANLVKEGKSTKEIADLFNLSRRTIDVHRDNIRKKLGIKNKKINLRTHLSHMR